MKKQLLTLLGILLTTYLYAQKVEVSVQANSGLFNYSGASTTGSSAIVQSPYFRSYTINPYGNKKAFSYGFDVQAQYISKNGFIAGLQTGYDILRSKVDITAVNLYSALMPPPNYDPSNKSTGETYLQNQSVNLNPYIGYRLYFHKIKLDILPGADIGININSYDKGKATIGDGTVYQTDFKKNNAPTDIRLKLGLAATYNRFGLTASYAYGLTNYEKNMISNYATPGTVNDAKSRLIRFGISYRVF